MASKDTYYVPCVRWRQAEYQALSALTEAAKDKIVPLITIPDLEYDFEDGVPKKNVSEHVGPFPKRYKAKWKTRKAWIDTDLNIQMQIMGDGRPVFTYVFDELRKFEANAIPVASLDCQPKVIAELAKIIAQDKKGVGIRARVEHVMKADFAAKLATLLTSLKIDASSGDLIIDLGTPNYEPYPAFASALGLALGKIANLDLYRSYVITGCAFPDSLKEVAVPGGFVDRHDWNFYLALRSSLPKDKRRPLFGDYTTVHPAFTAAMDMRKIKPAGKLVYTTGKRWMIRKGGAFRDNPGQMHGHCDYVVNSGLFRGAGFSFADNFIEKCANEDEGPSNQTRWKSVSINHHIMHVIDEVASLGGKP
jgi:hypothetical protein